MENNNNNEQGSWSAASLAWELGYLIAIPLVVLAIAGKLADKKLGTSPWLLLAGIILAILISSWTVYKKSTEIINKK